LAVLEDVAVMDWPYCFGPVLRHIVLGAHVETKLLTSRPGNKHKEKEEGLGVPQSLARDHLPMTTDPPRKASSPKGSPQ
jgi:hypothetical protein